MKVLWKNLPTEEFVQVHRSFIVRIDKIENFEGNFVVVGGESIPVSTTHKRLIKERFLFI